MTQEELKEEVVALRTKMTQIEGQQSREAAEFRASVADIKLQLERQKQQSDGLSQQHGEFKSRAEPALQESEKFRHKVEALAGLAKLFMGTATSLLIVLVGLGFTEYSAGRVRDERINNLDKRVTDLDKRVTDYQKSNEEAFKAIQQSLARIEAAKK